MLVKIVELGNCDISTEWSCISCGSQAPLKTKLQWTVSMTFQWTSIAYRDLNSSKRAKKSP